MEWKLPDQRLSEYQGMLKNAQDLEANIGSAYCRIQKLVDMRKGIDETLRSWWETVLKELSLDNKNDYMISQEGSIQIIPRKDQVPSPAATELNKSLTGTNASELK